MGICLGLQLLFEKSEESPGVEGLGILKGEILRIPAAEGLKIPHMGWNNIRFPNKGRLFAGVPEDAYVYFVHSYYLKAQDEKIVTQQPNMVPISMLLWKAAICLPASPSGEKFPCGLADFEKFCKLEGKGGR